MKKLFILSALCLSSFAFAQNGEPVTEDYIGMVAGKIEMQGLPVKCFISKNITDSNGRTCKGTYKFGVMAISVGSGEIDQEYVSPCFEYKYEAEEALEYLVGNGICQE